jgi:hypothetical protein
MDNSQIKVKRAAFRSQHRKSGVETKIYCVPQLRHRAFRRGAALSIAATKVV